MRKILEYCPTCDAPTLIITEVRCGRCDTVIRSQYRPTLFSRLTDENLRFLELFVKNRGNVKEMERELGISYWTIRSRLDEIIDELGFGREPAGGMPAGGAEAARRAVLDRLEAGDITVAEAAAELDALSSD